MKREILILCAIFGLFILWGCVSKTWVQKAEKYENDGNLVEASRLYEIALTVNPKDTGAREKLNKINAMRRQLAGKHYLKGLEHERIGKFLAARQEFLTAIRLWPDYSDALRKLAHVRIKAEGYVKHPIQPGENLSILASNYYGNSREFLKIAKYNQILDATKIEAGQTIKIPKIKGMPFKAYGKQIFIVDHFPTKPDQTEVKNRNKNLEPEPRDQIALYKNRGIDLFNDGKYLDAIETLKLVLRAAPDDKVCHSYISKSYLQLATNHFNNQDYITAKDDIEASLRHDPDCWECKEQLNVIEDKLLSLDRDRGIELYNQKNYKEATHHFHNILKSKHNDQITVEYLFKSHFQYGTELLTQEKYIEAKNEYQNALNIKSDCKSCAENIERCDEYFKELHYRKGNEYLEEHKLEEAISQWQMVQDVDPNYEKVDENIKKACKRLKRFFKLTSKNIDELPEVCKNSLL